MEGKDCPQQIGQKEYDELDKMVSLILRMCISIFVSGKAMVFGSGFCVAKGITELKEKVVYTGALVKKRR